MSERNKKRRNMVIGAAAALILLAGIIVMSVNITEISVTGNQHYTEQQIIDMLFESAGDRNTAYCYYKNKFKEHKQIPFVEDYSIVFHGLNRAEIIVYEKSVVGYVAYMSSYMYFDKDGMIVESTSTRLDGIPEVTGLKFSQIVLYQPLPVEDSQVFDEILNLTQVLSVYDIAVDKIQYDDQKQATLCIGQIRVVLGDNSSISGKIGELRDQLPYLEGESGTLYLNTYDETNSGAWYSFIRD